MKRLVLFAFIFVAYILTGCTPDLVVKNLDVTWDNVNKKAKAKIANIGQKDAGSFLVYFNGEENPVSPNHRPHVSHNVAGLDKGASIILEADFAPLSHPDNNNLGNVYQISVLVDPKNMVNESNEGNNVKSVPVSHGIACVDFGPPPAAGTEYGSSAGNVPGDVVIVSPNGIKVAVHDFRWGTGGGTFNYARIEMPPQPIGAGQAIRTGNINLEFDFTGIGFPVSKVDFQYLDLGGFENLSINGQPVPVYAGELTGAPSSIAGVNVNVSSIPVPGGKAGTGTLTGPVQTFRLGGQEFWIDNVCARK